MEIIRTLTGELLELFPYFGLKDYTVLDDGSMILCNDGGKIGVIFKDGEYKLIPNHEKEFNNEYTGGKHNYSVYVQFVEEFEGRKYVKKKIELKEKLPPREFLDMIQEMELYAMSNGLAKGWENIKEVCEEIYKRERNVE